MSNADISGLLDLFEMPFCKPQACGRQANQQKQNTTESAPQLTPATATEQAERTKSQTETAPIQDVRRKTAEQSTGGNTEPDTPDAQPKTTTPADASAKESASAAPKAPAPAATPEQKKELVLDMPAGATDANPLTASDQEKRKAHEKAEAKRRAKWEAKQLKKKQAEEAAIQKIKDMSDADVTEASTARIHSEVERLTRRKMKDCVGAHVENISRIDPAFARRTMHPRKSMVSCFRYINRMAKEYILQEMEDNDIKPENGGYGGDVPDDIVYQWAEDYFKAEDLPEDRREEDTFTPKPYTGTTAPKEKTKKTTAKKKSEKKQEPKPEYEQMSFL